MKLLSTLFAILCFLSSFGQDTTYRARYGPVEFNRKGIGNVYAVLGSHSKFDWITGKVRQVNFEYWYKPQFHGSTRPANPDFFKARKRKSRYYVPVDDVIILNTSTKNIYQSFNMDSLIMRSYFDDGTRKEIVYFNEDLQVDSVFLFYENGNLRTKIVGIYNQPEDNLVLSMAGGPDLRIRVYPALWHMDTQMMVGGGFIDGGNYPDVKGSNVPMIQYECHGNGIPQMKIEHIQDDSLISRFDRAFSFFDPQGNPSDSASMTNDGQWMGIQYRYRKNGLIQSRGDMHRGRRGTFHEQYNYFGELKSIRYSTDHMYDSTVHYKRFPDTVLKWTGPMHFTWFEHGGIDEVKHRSFSLKFKQNGELHGYALNGVGYSYTSGMPLDTNEYVKHYGGKGAYHLPHGLWCGVNGYGDTIYKANYKNGYLHGELKISSSHWPYNWTKIFDMGQLVDSAYQTLENGHLRQNLFYDKGGNVAKKIEYMFGDGRVSNIDTTLNGRTFLPLLRVHHQGWIQETASIDKATNRLHSKRYFAKDSISSEVWRDLHGNIRETKSYHRETGNLKGHWIDDGFKTIETDDTIPDYDDHGNYIGEVPRKRAVKLATRLTYDLDGNLLKTEHLEDGVAVE